MSLSSFEDHHTKPLGLGRFLASFTSIFALESSSHNARAGWNTFPPILGALVDLGIISVLDRTTYRLRFKGMIDINLVPKPCPIVSSQPTLQELGCG